MFARVRAPLDQFQAQRIALIKPSALGDIIHTLPLLEALRIRFPAAEITWIINRSYASLIQNHPALDHTLSFDRQSLKRGIGAALETIGNFARGLRRRRFDLVIDAQGLLRSGIMAIASGAPRRIGLEGAREGAHWAYTDIVPVPDRKTIHAVDRLWCLARALGVGDLPKKFRVPIAPAERSWAETELQDLPRPWAVFGVGSRWQTKRWPPEHFTVLAQRVQAEFGGTILFVGTPDEAPLSQQVRGMLHGPTRDYTGKTTLPQLAALLEKADVMVTNDTGPLHLAAALDRPVVAPYTCTQIRRHGPYGVARGPVEARVWCQGSYLKKCNRLECMAELAPDRLWCYLSEILARWAAISRSA